MNLPTVPHAEVRAALLARREIALLDLREEEPFAQAHPLWAANLPLSRLELDAWERIPRRDTQIVLYGEHDGADLVATAAQRLQALGYTKVHALQDGLDGWRAAGGELFRDVNVASKAFGEWVEHHRQTPSLPAEEVRALIDAGADLVILDARRFDEYRTMSIPGATSVPGAELVLRVAELAPDPATRVVVNCAGRTRSIIGTQSLVNAGIPNPVASLRNGTIGWLLAGQALDHGATRRPPATGAAGLAAARERALSVAGRAGVRRTALANVAALAEAGRTLYRFDVRSPEEYEAGHLPDFASAPGGQLVQETDHHVPVRGARIVLDDGGEGVRAAMTASWLAQLGWEVWMVDGDAAADGAARTATGAWLRRQPGPPPAAIVSAHTLAGWRERGGAQTEVIDVGPGAAHAAGHVPGAWFVVRAQLADALRRVPDAGRYVLTSPDGVLASFAAHDLAALRPDAAVFVLEGGTAGWVAAGMLLEQGDSRLATARTDRYRRPYEGTDAPREAMQAYLDWEFGLVAQLLRDGTHHFRVI